MEKENKVKKNLENRFWSTHEQILGAFFYEKVNKGKEKTGTNLSLQNTLNYIVPSKQEVIVKREMKKSNTIKHLETFCDKDLIKRT